MNHIADAVAAIRHKTQLKPDVGVILGSGLGALADEVESATRIPYAEIPHFPESTVAGHAGALVMGTLEGQRVAAFQGRIHYYEGYGMEEVTFPCASCALGAGTMPVTNAVGGISDKLVPGDLVAIRDHINFMGTNPLRGRNDDTLGPRFPRMDDAYDEDLRLLAHEAARTIGFELKDGVYLALSGPTYETKAEIRFFRMVGADTVGMSTVPEVLVARHMDMRVLGVSCVTNVLHGNYTDVTHEDVLKQAKVTGPRFISLMRKILAELPAR